MPNRLAHEKSPYLLQHADNPVEWYAWSDDAFAKARAEQKPVFLSIGYSTCHWCHVMAHESFENDEIAAVLNQYFVPIKVDREERPDVDRVYMAYVQALTGHGGWPLNAWLTPELKPFFGGTYFPPEDRKGRGGFASILKAIARGWDQEREKLVREVDRVMATLREHYGLTPAAGVGGDAGTKPAGAAGAPPVEGLLDAASGAFERVFEFLNESFDPAQGGFGGAPKFPRASNLNFLFRCAAIQGPGSEAGKAAIQLATVTLQKMAEGGLHDHVGGGFHRYSVDEAWFVPHFEKMLYDQAQIAVNYLDAFRATQREIHAWLARDIFDYVLRELSAPQGGFYSAEDADSLRAHGRPEHAEGAFYVWTRAELEAALGADAAFFCDHFGVKAEGNVPPELDPHGELQGRNILAQRQPLATTASAHGLDLATAGDRLVALLEKLRAVRAQRPRPHLDDKIITAWNGLMIAAFARAAVSPAEALADKREFYREAAVRAAAFIERELYDADRGVLYRNHRHGRGAEGFAEDYAQLIAGLIELYEATFEVRWLQWAEGLQQTMDLRFWDEAGGGYFNSAAGDVNIVLRLKEDYDGAEPSPNSVAAGNLLRLAAITGESAGATTPAGVVTSAAGAPAPGDAPRAETPADTVSYRRRALQTIEALRPQWSRTPHALPEMLCAMERALQEPRHVVIAGRPGAPDFEALVAVVRSASGPHRTVLAADGAEGQRWLAARAPWLAEMRPLEGRAAAYVCEHFACQAPVTTPGELRGLMNT